MTLSRSLKITVLAAIALLVLAVSQQTIPTTSATFNDSDGDGVSDLAEELAGSDPNDPNSLPESTGAEFLSIFFGPSLPLCSDGVDNDLDGLTDGEDPHCTDSDNDIVSDPTEVLLGSDPNDSASFPEDARLDALLESVGLPVFFCADAIDNDGDGLTDADDPGCDPIDSDGDGVEDAAEKRFGSDPTDPNSAPEHETPNPGSCSDGIDNDQNGLTDDADPGCGSPVNDDRANATVVGALPYTDGPTVLKNATFEPDEPRPACAFSLGGTIWYRYTAVEDGVVIADIEADDLGTVIAVWRETASGLEGVACAADFSLTGARAVVSLEGGETYLFQVDAFAFGFETLLPAVTFTLEAGDPPANDGFLEALLVDALPFSDSVDVTAATRQRGEPTCGYGNESSVWYSFSPDEDTFVVADSDGSDYAAIIGIWTESKFGLIREECSLPGSAVALEAEAGETYFFQISRFSGFFFFGPEPEPSEPPGFSLQFNLSIAVPPPNDDFANAQPVASLPFTMTVNNLTATDEDDEPTPSCLQPYGVEYTLWYSYTAARDEILVADTGGSAPYDIAIGVYTGDVGDTLALPALADLTEVACSSLFSFPTRVGFEAEAGTTYYFQLGTLTFENVFFAGRADEQSNAAGIFFPIDPHEITFNLRAIEVPSCPPPEFKVEDPLDDATGFFFGPAPDDVFRPDITSVSGAFTDDDFCITIEFDEPLPAQGDFASGSVSGEISFDSDQDTTTGLPYFSFQCGTEGRLGSDAVVEIAPDSLLAEIRRFDFFSEPVRLPPPEFEPDPSAIILRGERSLTVVVPLDAIGGDQFFDFTVAVYSNGFQDCVPNGGYITSPVPASLGDVNCDGAINSIDAALIVQMWADLSQSLPCQHIADVNGSGVIGPIDALLILQYDAGLLADLPP
ncbi:MAG: hypothetical protein IIC91_02150 [Chloroflexi bacterium]|nr:hypothetical protein [Chloroflexota bacterium]